MKLNDIHKVYFIGAGGIGMSALAHYMIYLGKNVAGYDRTPTEITQGLSDMGMYIQFTDDLKLIPNLFLDKNTWVVYTPAIKREENRILEYYLSNDYKVVKRAEYLALITKDTISLAVAGTHGKTSTTSLLGHILKVSNIPTTSFLGGIAANYNSNLIIGGNTYTVVEADEFDKSFLQLTPDYACITSIDADHLDIYGQAENLKSTFKEFATLAKKKLFVRKGIPINGITYGINEDADYNATNLRIENGVYIFDVNTLSDQIKDLKIQQPGKHNVLNTVAALAMANSIGVSLQDIAKALLSFKGVNRRFSYRIKTADLVMIDDYAHHPTEIDAMFKTVREIYPKDKVLVVFQPHLYSRTRDFEDDFVASLSQFDDIILLPIYPAREKKIAGVSSNVLVTKIKETNLNVKLVEKKHLIQKIKEVNNKIVLMLGAGDIGEMVKGVAASLIK